MTLAVSHAPLRAAVDPRHPIGRPQVSTLLTPLARAACVDAIAELPGRLRAAVAWLDDAQLDTPYHDGGRTVRQLIHHLADRHMLAYTHTRFALAGSSPSVTVYEEAEWGALRERCATPPEVSLSLLDALHARWVHTLRATRADAFARSVRHPAHGLITVDGLVHLYAWHGRHHTAHVTALRARMGW